MKHVSLVIAAVVERSRFALEADCFKSSDAKGGDGRFVHLKINRTVPR